MKKKSEHRKSYHRKRKTSSIKKQKKIKPVGYLRKRRSKLSAGQVLLRAGISLLGIAMIISVGISALWGHIFSGLRQNSNENNLFPTQRLTHQPPEMRDVVNILLLGVDRPDHSDDRGRSDSMIILTIDRRENIVKLTSILRDSYTYILGQDNPNRINAAHSFGGPALALRTVNDTFRLNIKNYISVDMGGMASLIDIAGGVMIDVSPAEMRDMNRRLHTNPISAPGYQELTGRQAVEYSRIRIIDSDWARTGRQREVLLSLFESFRELGPVSKARMIQKGISYVTTNMTPGEITYLGIDLMPKISEDIEEMRLPLEGYYRVNNVGRWFLEVDYNGMIPEVHKFIFGQTYEFDPVPTLPYRAVTATLYPEEPEETQKTPGATVPEETTHPTKTKEPEETQETDRTEESEDTESPEDSGKPDESGEDDETETTSPAHEETTASLPEEESVA